MTENKAGNHFSKTKKPSILERQDLNGSRRYILQHSTKDQLLFNQQLNQFIHIHIQIPHQTV